MAKTAKKDPVKSRQLTKRPPGRPKDEDRQPKALTQEQLTVLKLMGITPEQIGIASAPVLEGPEPETLDGKPLTELATWLGAWEAFGHANKDGQGDVYRKRAGKVRWLIWKSKYTITPA